MHKTLKVDFSVLQIWMHMEWCLHVFQSWTHMESWMYSCNIIAIESSGGLSMHSVRVALLVLTVCCNPTTVYWGVVLTTTNWLLLLCYCNSKWSTDIQPNFYMNSILSLWVCEEGVSSFSLLLCLQNSQLINCNFKGTMGLTISQLVMSFRCYVWKQSNMVHEKQFYCNTAYVQELCAMSCCLVQQQSRLVCMLVLFIAGICIELSSLEPYLCMGYDCQFWVQVSLHWQINSQYAISLQYRGSCLWSKVMSSKCLRSISGQKTKVDG